MVVEAAVFDRQHRVDHVLRDRSRAARSGASGPGRARPAAAPRASPGRPACRRASSACDTTGDGARRELDADDARRRPCSAIRGTSVTIAGADARTRPARSAFRPLGVADVVQPLHELRRRQRPARPDLERPAEDARHRPLLAAEPRVDHPAVADPEVDDAVRTATAEHAGDDERGCRTHRFAARQPEDAGACRAAAWRSAVDDRAGGRAGGRVAMRSQSSVRQSRSLALTGCDAVDSPVHVLTRLRPPRPERELRGRQGAAPRAADGHSLRAIS